MKHDQITSLQYGTLAFFLMNSFIMNIGYSILSNISHNDAILDLFLGGIEILIISYFILKIKHKNKINLLDQINHSCPSIIKWIFYLFLFLMMEYVTIYSLSTLVSFIHFYILKEVNIFIITITITITILYIVSKELSTICKISEIFFYIYIFIFIVGSIGLIQYMDIENLKPLFTTNAMNHLTSSHLYLLSEMIPLFFIFVIPSHKITTTHHRHPYPVLFMMLSILFCLFQFITIISVLGIQLTNLFQYPEMIAFKKISILNLLERMEVLLSFNHILNSLFFISMSIYTMKKILSFSISKKKEPILLALIGISVVLLSNLITTSYFHYLKISFLFLLILLLLCVHYFARKYIRS